MVRRTRKKEKKSSRVREPTSDDEKRQLEMKTLEGPENRVVSEEDNSEIGNDPSEFEVVQSNSKKLELQETFVKLSEKLRIKRTDGHEFWLNLIVDYENLAIN